MIFLDSSNHPEIERFYEFGIISGVTTNPTIMKKDGVTDFYSHMKEIAEYLFPLPVSVEVTSNIFGKMMQQAQDLSKLSSNINIKIPIHGPQGEIDNLVLINQLKQLGIEVNATAMMNAQQCLLASLAGATYVSIFGGRVNNMGYDSCQEISKLRNLIDRFNLKSISACI